MHWTPHEPCPGEFRLLCLISWATACVAGALVLLVG